MCLSNQGRKQYTGFADGGLSQLALLSPIKNNFIVGKFASELWASKTHNLAAVIQRVFGQAAQQRPAPLAS